MNRLTDQRTRQGFSLIELLVVIAIIGMLGGVMIWRINRGAKEDVRIQATRAFITAITTALEVYKNDRSIGIFPPTSLENFQGLGRLANRTNLGIESLIVCLNSPGFNGERILDKFESRLENSDNDKSARALTVYSATDLFEIRDEWDNPLAYFNCNDYTKLDVRQYLVTTEAGGEPELVNVEPKTNPKTKSFYNLTSYQLISAGPDRQFGTEDDIGNW